MPNFNQSFLANRDQIYGTGSKNNGSGSASATPSIRGISPSFEANRQAIYSEPPRQISPISQPTPQPKQQPNFFQQAGSFIGNEFKQAQDFVNKELKSLQGVKVTLTPQKPQVQKPQATPTPTQQPKIVEHKNELQKNNTKQPDYYTLPDGTRLPAKTYLTQGKAPSIWDKIVGFFGELTGNGELDKKARAANAYAIQKVDGEKLYQKRVQAAAKDQKLDPKALDQAIQKEARNQGISKFDMVGLGLSELAKQGGNPFKNSTMEDVTKELGIRDMPTNKEFTDILMTAALGFGLAEAPLATIKAVGIFSGVDALKQGTISALRGHGFNIASGDSLSSFTPNAPMPVQTALDFLDFLGTAAITHQVFKLSPKIGEKLTKDVIEKYNVPETVQFSPEQVQKVIKGEELGKVKEDLAKAGLTSKEWRDAAQKGIQISMPTEKIVQIVDKPYWKKFKGLLGMSEAAPKTSIVKEGKKITNIAGYLPSGEYTADEVLAKVINSPIADTPEGKALVKVAIQAKEAGADVKIDVPQLEAPVKTKEVVAKEEAQKQVRIKEAGTYKSAIDQKTTEDLHNDPIKYRDEYLQKYDNVVNPDLARHLAPEYNGLNAQHVNNFGVSLKNIVLKHLLDTGKERKDSNHTVLWTGGNPGSGKSTSLSTISPNDKKAYVAIIDTTFSPNSTVRDISKVLKQGYKVQVKFTLSDPFESWKRVISRALAETDSNGNKNPDYQRIVSEEYFINSVKESRKNALEAYDKFKSNPDFSIEFFDNTGKREDYHETTVDFVRNFNYNEAELRSKIYEYTDELKQKGKISEEVYKEFTSDRLKEVGRSAQESAGVSTSQTVVYPLHEVEKDIPLETARNAHYWNSFNPDKAAEFELRSYKEGLTIAYDELKKLVKTPEDQKTLDTLFWQFREGYKKRFLDVLNAKSKTASSAVTGGSNFPVAKNQKALDNAHNKEGELYSYEDYMKKKIANKLNPTIINAKDSDAVQQLQKKVDNLKEKQDLMLKANKIIRSGKDVEKQLKDLGLSEEKIKNLLTPYFGKTGFQSFELTNNNNKIKTAEKRLNNLQKVKDTTFKDVPFKDGYVTINPDEYRIQIHFDSIPDVEMRDKLKSNGFRWSPKNKAWQRQLTPNGRRATEQLLNISLSQSEAIERPATPVTPAADVLDLKPTEATKPEEIMKEMSDLNLPPSVLKLGGKDEVAYGRPRISRTDLKTIAQNSQEFRDNPVLKVENSKNVNFDSGSAQIDKNLVFEGEKIHFSISAQALGLQAENLKEGDTIKVDLNTLKSGNQQMRVFKNGSVLASTGSTPLGKFADRGEQGRSKKDFKLAQETKDLVRKYAERVGEYGMPTRNAIGLFHPESRNIQTHGMNDFSTNVHEVSHAIDHSFGWLSMEIAKKVGETSDGKPKYDPTTRALRKEMTQLYAKYYPTGNPKNKVSVRMKEGFATLLQKYVEMPDTISAEFPNIYREFLSTEGKYYKPLVGEFIQDANKVVEEYQGLNGLDKIGSRVVKNTISTDKTWLNWRDKLRITVEDEIWGVEKIGIEAGTQWTGNDPSLWLRQYSRGGGIYANNILNKKNGYWTLNDSGDFVKKYDYNWSNLIDRLQKGRIQDDFGYFLVARDQVKEWKELDTLKTKALELIDQVKEVGQQEAAQMIGEDGKTLLQEALDAKKAYQEQKKYLDNNGFTRDEVTNAYVENKDRFIEETKMYDSLVREDLNLMNNPLVGIVTPERYREMTAQEGYASMKRQFFDDILGEAKESYQGAGGRMAVKISSLKKRTGGQQQIINPVLNSMVNHIEVVKKSLKQVVYNKHYKIAHEGKVPDMFQEVAIRSFKDDTGKIIFPQERDSNIIMARVNYKRVAILTDRLYKQMVDDALTYQNMNIFEHLLTTAGRVFTIGTTGAYAPFALVNFPADQWNAVLNTRNDYTPIKDQLKLLGRVLTRKGGKIGKYWEEWEILGGDKMTLFQAQMQDYDKAIKYITKERNGIQKALDLVDKGVDIGSLPAKYSETISRFTEYVKAREAGKAQVVALEEAGRVTAPFHHIGSWKVGDRMTGKYIIKSIPFGNASMQVIAQAIRTSGTEKGRKRLYFVLLAATAAYLGSMYAVSQLGSDDQKEQYKDLRPSDLTSFIYLPALSGHGLVRIRISQEFTTIGTIMNMILAQNLLGVKYTAEDYKDAATGWTPRQVDVLSPVEMFFSWFNPAIKIPIEVLANFKDYPRISPIENQSMQNLEPKDRYNEYTSALAKQLGATFNLSPIKIDYLISGLFGRATNFLTGKPGAYNPVSQVDREYLLTLGRRVENFYENKTKLDQKYASLREKYKDQETIPQAAVNEYYDIKNKREAYAKAAQLLKWYREIPEDKKDIQKKARLQILPVLEKLPQP